MDIVNNVGNNINTYYDNLINTDLSENRINDLYKIIQNKYDTSTINKDSIYDELMNKEGNIKEVIDRIIDYKKKQKLDDLFVNTKFKNIFMNIFKTLNHLIDDLTKHKDISYKQLKKMLNKEHRLIYIGLFMIMIAFFLSLIEISDKI